MHAWCHDRQNFPASEMWKQMKWKAERMNAAARACVHVQQAPSEHWSTGKITEKIQVNHVFNANFSVAQS
jgi:hypothetical protein